MQLETQFALKKDAKLAVYLKDNSFWYKELNRSPNNYKSYASFIKEKYKLKTTDKINSVVENIDIINSVLNVIK